MNIKAVEAMAEYLKGDFISTGMNTFSLV